MKRDVLERPFEAHLIKSRRGHSGKSFTYVEGAEYIKRLNEAFDGQWSFEIMEHHVRHRDVVVVGRLDAGGCTKIAFGGAVVTTSQQTGEPLNLADDLKAAATDALKKAASLFGVGLHLHSSDSAPKEATVEVLGTRLAGSGGGSGSGPTERQVNAIMAIGRKLGLTSETLRQRAIDRFGSPLEELSRSDASALIDELKLQAKSAA